MQHYGNDIMANNKTIAINDDLFVEAMNTLGRAHMKRVF